LDQHFVDLVALHTILILAHDFAEPVEGGLLLKKLLGIKNLLFANPCPKRPFEVLFGTGHHLALRGCNERCSSS
jgi:hypothetical protein